MRKSGKLTQVIFTRGITKYHINQLHGATWRQNSEPNIDRINLFTAADTNGISVINNYYIFYQKIKLQLNKFLSI